jgi:hypothetical protein
MLDLGLRLHQETRYNYAGRANSVFLTARFPSGRKFRLRRISIPISMKLVIGLLKRACLVNTNDALQANNFFNIDQ